MSQLLSTDPIPPRERLAYWTDMICTTYVQLECDAPDAEGFGGSIQSHHLPGLDLSVVRSRAQRVVRTPRSISRAADDCFIVSLQTRGHGVISQDGRDAAVAPGDFALYDSTRPYTLQFSEDFEEIVLKLRGEQLRALVTGTEQLTATTVSGRSGAGHLMAHMVTALRDEADRLPAASAAAVASGVISVLAAGLQSLPACHLVEPSAMGAYHVARIKRHIDARLRDPGLSVESVARDLGMSSGHLHRLFKTEPQSPSHYLWGQRLDGASRELLDARRARASVSEIAFGWGFNDAAHFSRAFKERFGRAPREWRAQGPAAARG
ncbi:AraC-like DNA-binding protein [Acidovorax soli]|jgi:AraC-like DNA-binding protein|uniref:AraC-like DNA-binding protein n=1 Tax=Acidovorax soli TaxID=592050 RepID=A0A7X0PL96_9BURK|nr:helix-turn-helix domain-containing protein [Acidovorax soli]MBB6563466.1 AraC-like DNA-binding protein [Acidovorax soli]